MVATKGHQSDLLPSACAASTSMSAAAAALGSAAIKAREIPISRTFFQEWGWKCQNRIVEYKN
eukprot:8783712-Prorocentrum_lima.AAC.1